MPSANNFVNRTTGKKSFEIVIGIQPRGISNLRDITSEVKRSAKGEVVVDVTKSLHEEVKLRLEKSN